MVRLLNAIGVPQGPKARAGGEHERGGGHTPSRKGGHTPSHKGGSGKFLNLTCL